uniref:hypothetical protein n=1 Tax=uncultured Paracoccus sp. TaxID=189685 RepID=UPI00260F8903
HVKKLSSEEQKNLICGILEDLATDSNVELLCAYLRHCGLPLQTLRSASDIVPTFLNHYRIQPGLYDVERAWEDLRWWPPIAERIAKLDEKAQTQTSPSPECKNIND